MKKLVMAKPLSEYRKDQIRELCKLVYQLGETRKEQKILMALNADGKDKAKECEALSLKIYEAEKIMGMRGI